jgi:elongator complex protein 4
VAVGRSATESTVANSATHTVSGVRPSSLTSHRVTSTGAASLDNVLGGHGGLALGCSLLLAESGTTDFAGALLSYFAAEGICHGHTLHVVGIGDPWFRDLPGVASQKRGERNGLSATDEEKMKIAWRYERLGPAGERGAWIIVALAVEAHAQFALQIFLSYSNTDGKYSAS